MDYKPEINGYFERLKTAIDSVSREELNQFMNILVDTRDAGNQVFTMGNGGSAQTASHYVCDFNKGLSRDNEKRFKFICLNDNLASLMAYANDLSYDEVFREQLKNFISAGDLVIGISGSGNSMNVVNAIEYANENDAVTVALTGFDGGRLKRVAQYQVHVAINDMQITEDLHMIYDHCIMKTLCNY